MRTAAFVVARSRAVNLVQSAPARLLDLAKLCAILREIGSRLVTEACAPVSKSRLCQFRSCGGAIGGLGGVRHQRTSIDLSGPQLRKQNAISLSRFLIRALIGEAARNLDKSVRWVEEK
jgi:hypothetical protein